MDVRRRTFLKLSGLAAAGSVLGGLVPSAAAQNPTPGIAGVEGKAMLNDPSKCIGCLSCAIACKKANHLPDIYEYSPETGGKTWTTVRFQPHLDPATKNNIKTQCMHCNKASCVAVCPTGAAYKRIDGIVLIDQETCVGCKYCVVACPFKVPGLSEETGTVRKCTYCEARLREGKIPACAEACPVQAIEYGNYNELQEKAGARVDYLKQNGYQNAALYGLTELDGLKVIYVLPDPKAKGGLPAQPKLATGNSLTKWAAGLITAGILVTAPLRTVFNDIDTPAVNSREKSGVTKDG